MSPRHFVGHNYNRYTRCRIVRTPSDGLKTAICWKNVTCSDCLDTKDWRLVRLTNKHLSILHHALDICDSDYSSEADDGSKRAKATLREIERVRVALGKGR